MTSLQDRDLRQRELVPPEKAKEMKATVVGVGAIGRQVALQLAAMGVPTLQLIDPDGVEVVNLAPQGYLEADLGKTKVEATAAVCRQINSQIELELCPERFRRSLEVHEVLFCCVDSITARRHIWEAVKDRVLLFVDGRMSADVMRVLAAGDGEMADVDNSWRTEKYTNPATNIFQLPALAASVRPTRWPWCGDLHEAPARAGSWRGVESGVLPREGHNGQKARVEPLQGHDRKTNGNDMHWTGCLEGVVRRGTQVGR
jgi:sulfur carrier protein ThiS adenylyltransferase